MKNLILFAVILFTISCGNNQNNNILPLSELKTEAIPQKDTKINIIDSLILYEDAGEIVSETYKGIIPAASCVGIEYTVTIYHQQSSGDGVFHATLNYLEAENGKNQCFDVYGRQYTLRGHSDNINSTVIQLVSFRGDDIMNFLKQENKIIMLDQELREIESEANYTLKKQIQEQSYKS